MRHLRHLLRSLLGVAVTVCVLLPGCSEGTVSAPQGGSIVLEASPAVIGLGGQSQITALVRDQNGNPVRGDVEVLFFTDLGSIDRAARTNSRGLATATLTAGNTPGTATVRAVAGPNEAQIGVPIGTQVGDLTLQASPDSIPNTGGESQLVAVVHDSDDNPVVGAPVTFSTEVGELESQGEPVDTDDGGEAVDRVTVTPDDVGNRSSFFVTATTPGPGGSELSDRFEITFDVEGPVAQFDFAPAGGNSVQFDASASTGEGTLMYSWDFGDGTDDSTEVDPLHTFPAQDTYTVTLTVSESDGDSDMTSETIEVPL